MSDVLRGGRRSRSFICIALVAALASSIASFAHAAELRIGGAGTTLGTMKELGDAYTRLHPDMKITVLPSLGAVGGVEALRSGAADIATSTRKLTEAEHANELTMSEVARIPFVFAVGSGNKTNDVTSAQLLEMYQGKMTAWPDGARIRLVLRPPSVSDTIFLKELSPEWKKAMSDLEARQGMLVVATAQEAADRVEKTPGAITTSTINLIVTEKRAMKALRIDGVAPTSTTISDGSYRFYKPVILVTLPKATAAVQSFVAFVRSSAGRDILVRTGHVPLAGSK